MAKHTDNNSSNTALAAGAATGLVFAAIAGPIGALIGSVLGAGLGFWHDKKEHSSKKHLLGKDQVKKIIA